MIIRPFILVSILNPIPRNYDIKNHVFNRSPVDIWYVAFDATIGLYPSEKAAPLICLGEKRPGASAAGLQKTRSKKVWNRDSMLQAGRS